MTGQQLSYRALSAVEQFSAVNTASLFKVQAGNAVPSPIDRFISNANRLNLIYLPYNTAELPWVPELGNIVFLGYMSAVESYFRAVISSLINVDDVARKRAAPKTVSFALARGIKDKSLLPEALMENMAFSTAGNIEKALSDLVGLDKLSDDVVQVLKEFKRLCEIRHCCVHRFGKLGSQNAMVLGFDIHIDKIEQPFTPTFEDTVSICSTLQTTIKTVNNYIFREILDRTIINYYKGAISWTWSWHYGKDRRKFQQYYDIFAIKGSNPGTAAPKELYESFRIEKAAMAKTLANKAT